MGEDCISVIKKDCIMKYPLGLLPHPEEEAAYLYPELFAAFVPLFTHLRHNLLQKLTQPVQLVPVERFITKSS